jgi:sterol desaturase/sphingolipid hydroxylase (fatty acid hydroxylase superfamily)
VYPLTVFETTVAQITADRHERRKVIGMSLRQLGNCLRVAIVESCGISLAIWLSRAFELKPGPPSVLTLLFTVLLAPAFDLGLDLGFWTFHRTSHKVKWLYIMVHADHHVDTAKDHGRLVAYETYSITWLETVSILSCYFVGLSLCMVLKWSLLGWHDSPVTVFEVAFLVTWGHTVELLGHTATQWTPHHHPNRIIFEITGIDLKVPHHTMHHVRPLTNFSKRCTFWDHVFGTYGGLGTEEWCNK